MPSKGDHFVHQVNLEKKFLLRQVRYKEMSHIVAK